MCILSEQDGICVLSSCSKYTEKQGACTMHPTIGKIGVHLCGFLCGHCFKQYCSSLRKD